MFEILWRCEIAAAMGHVVFEAIGLFVRLVAVGFGAAEGFGHEEGGRGSWERSGL